MKLTQNWHLGARIFSQTCILYQLFQLIYKRLDYQAIFISYEIWREKYQIIHSLCHLFVKVLHHNLSIANATYRWNNSKFKTPASKYMKNFRSQNINIFRYRLNSAALSCNEKFSCGISRSEIKMVTKISNSFWSESGYDTLCYINHFPNYGKQRKK